MCNHKREDSTFFNASFSGLANSNAWKNTDNHTFDEKYNSRRLPQIRTLNRSIGCSCNLIKAVDNHKARLLEVARLVGSKEDYASLVSLACYIHTKAMLKNSIGSSINQGWAA